MAETSSIEWTDATWNPVTGCSVVSPGCTNCYAMRLAGTRLRRHPSRAGLTAPSKSGPVWNGQVRLNEQWLTQPLAWKRPRRIFVCAHGDLFHESVPDAWIDKVFAVMALAPQHTFQVLTKRAARMREYVNGLTRHRLRDAVPKGVWPISFHGASAWLDPDASPEHRALYDATEVRLPLPNVWLGVSAEDQPRADERIPDLLATPAAVRFVSAEPMLAPIDLGKIQAPRFVPEDHDLDWKFDALQIGEYYEFRDGLGYWEGGDGPDRAARLDWVIVGGESGPDARPMHPDWARQIRDDCAAAGVPFFFKQWGEWTPGENAPPIKGGELGASLFAGRWQIDVFRRREAETLTAETEPDLWHVGKHAAGRLLDGVEHNTMPATPASTLTNHGDA